MTFKNLAEAILKTSLTITKLKIEKEISAKKKSQPI